MANVSFNDKSSENQPPSKSIDALDGIKERLSSILKETKSLRHYLENRDI